jgi:spore coat polysaccharide biosynthesis protein SpsF
MKQRIVAIIQARMTSERLPGKVLMPLGQTTVLESMFERIRRSKYVEEIVVATTTNQTDDVIIECCQRNKVKYSRGSEFDVLTRVLDAAKEHQVDLICELFADSPLIDPIIIDQAITAHLAGDYDCTSTIDQVHYSEDTFPVGVPVHIFPTEVLQKVSDLTTDPIDRVHVSYFIPCNPKLFKLQMLTAAPQVSGAHIRLTLDTRADYEIISKVYEALYPSNPEFLTKDMVKYVRENPEVLLINKTTKQKKKEEG